jgi:hypothetical protein
VLHNGGEHLSGRLTGVTPTAAYVDHHRVPSGRCLRPTSRHRELGQEQHNKEQDHQCRTSTRRTRGPTTLRRRCGGTTRRPIARARRAGRPVVVAPSRRPDLDVTHSSPIAAFYPPSHAGGGLPTSTSSSLPIDRAPVAASRPPKTRLSPPEHTRRTDRAESPPHNSENYRVDDGQVECACRGREPGPTDPGVADRDGRAHLGVTAQRTPPESRWRRRGRGSSMSDAWTISGPLHTPNAVIQGQP